MFGKNPVRPPVKGDGALLSIKEIFPTVQGEGPLAGQPAVFVRLIGCNLQCSFCDTEFEDGADWPKEAILAEVQRVADGRRLVVITGGEPFRQPISPLCQLLLDAGFAVQIETNGTLYRTDLPDEVTIVCSPKNPTGKGYAPLRDDLLARTQALKFIVSADREGYKDAGDVGQGKYNIPVYVQPMDEYDEAQNQRNLIRVRELVASKGYYLSLQMHKILGVE